MSHSLSLIACPTKAPLLQEHVDLAVKAARSAGAETRDPVWLAPGEACQIGFGGSSDPVREGVRAALAGRPLDVNVIAAARQRKRLLVADMDSTLIRQECIDELAAEVGVGAEVAAITERAMRGEIAFEPALRARVRLLQGTPVETVQKVLAERIALMSGALTLVATMRAGGAYTALISGGFTAFAATIAQKLGVDEFRANALLASDGLFTGAVADPILGRQAKAETLRELTERLRLDPEETLAVGDGANDADMVRLAGLGVAYRAKPALQEVASAVIDHADLSALLFLQGYRREDFASPGAEG